MSNVLPLMKTDYRVTDDVIVITKHTPTGMTNIYKIEEVVIPKGVFIEAYNKWIAGVDNAK